MLGAFASTSYASAATRMAYPKCNVMVIARLRVIGSPDTLVFILESIRSHALRVPCMLRLGGMLNATPFSVVPYCCGS